MRLSAEDLQESNEKLQSPDKARQKLALPLVVLLASAQRLWERLSLKAGGRGAPPESPKS